MNASTKPERCFLHPEMLIFMLMCMYIISLKPYEITLCKFTVLKHKQRLLFSSEQVCKLYLFSNTVLFHIIFLVFFSFVYTVCNFVDIGVPFVIVHFVCFVHFTSRKILILQQFVCLMDANAFLMMPLMNAITHQL